MKYSDHFMKLLKSRGYTHCFFLAGGNSMHLLDSASKQFTCIPFIHEVSATIASEYFNYSSGDSKSFVLVTAGPGLTNTITGIAGAWLESRPLLVVGGQVKSDDLATLGVRQQGIQEIDGISLVASITKKTLRISTPVHDDEIYFVLDIMDTGRKGPVFIEVCLDVSAAQVEDTEISNAEYSVDTKMDIDLPQELIDLISNSQRPLLLVGNGVDKSAMELALPKLQKAGIPIAATWTGADRISGDYEYYAGRPNTYGMRWSNVFQQQADLLIAIGTRLNLQQTGFNWKEFVPNGKIVHVDIDKSEILKMNPKKDLTIVADANSILNSLANYFDTSNFVKRSEWIQFLSLLRTTLPIIEDIHQSNDTYISPYKFFYELSQITSQGDIIVPCSSGGTFTAVMQTFINKSGQRMITNKGLASMGYGLAGAIGAAFANPDNRVILLEGDGGFAQNLQELGTVEINKLNMKIFITSNKGYASIRTSQVNYFDGNYIGCDENTGLGLPDWNYISKAYSINLYKINPGDYFDSGFWNHFDSSEPTIFLLDCDPMQLYFPKVGSRVVPNGGMESAPIHEMQPILPDSIKKIVYRYF
jgi:acetolactate synthase-1/2/3 large subunit